MNDRIGHADLRNLKRWQRRMIKTFVGTWAFVVLFIAGDQVFDLSRALVISGFIVMLICLLLEPPFSFPSAARAAVLASVCIRACYFPMPAESAARRSS